MLKREFFKTKDDKLDVYLQMTCRDWAPQRRNQVVTGSCAGSPVGSFGSRSHLGTARGNRWQPTPSETSPCGWCLAGNGGVIPPIHSHQPGAHHWHRIISMSVQRLCLSNKSQTFCLKQSVLGPLRCSLDHVCILT